MNHHLSFVTANFFRKTPKTGFRFELSAYFVHPKQPFFSKMSGLYMLDYGAGNVRSLVNAVEKLGYDITFVKDPSDLKKAEVRIRARDCLLYGP